MKILQIVPTLEWEASGPSYSVPRLADGLGRAGAQVELLSVGGVAAPVAGAFTHTLCRRDFGTLPVLDSLWLSRALRQALNRKGATADVIHVNGLWVMPNVYPAWEARRSGAMLMASPRGTLSPVALARSPLRKAIFWRLLQHGALKTARGLHATSEQEYLDIRRAGFAQPVAVIPNGIDLPPTASGVRREGRRRLLFLGRVHPIKGLENLFEAWKALAPSFPDWELRLVGPGPQDYVVHLKRLALDMELPRVVFAGEAYGAAKSAEYAAADLYILPSFSENFGMTVAEALAHGVPVIATTGTPWRGLEEERCGWWASPDKAGLKQALQQGLALDRPSLTAMGVRGRAWMEREYSWDGVAREMTAAYRWLTGTGERPGSVRVD